VFGEILVLFLSIFERLATAGAFDEVIHAVSLLLCECSLQAARLELRTEDVEGPA